MSFFERKIMQERYKKLKYFSPEIYHQCVDSANAVTINHDLDLEAGADIENALVKIACACLKID